MWNLWKPIIALIFVFLCTACMPHVPHNIIDSPQLLTKPPSRDTATVIFVGISPFSFALYDGDNIIGAVAHRECMVSTVSPGKHLFSSFFKKEKLMDGRPRYMFLDSELDRGKIYYVLVSHHTIPFAGVFPDLVPIRERNDPYDYWKKLPEWLSDCKISVMTDETVAWNKELSSDYSGDRDYDYNGWINDQGLQKLKINPEDGVTTPVAPKH
jgi:hypothetical protein